MPDRFGVEIETIENDKAAKIDAIDQQRANHFLPVRFGQVVTGYQSAQGDSRERIKDAEGVIHDLATDVLEIAVDAVRACGFQVFMEISGLVINAGVKAEFFHCVFTFFRTTGNSYCAAALHFRELTNDAADCPAVSQG